jgi:hypothetical protein
MRKVIVSILFWLPLLAHAADCKDRLSAWSQKLHPGRELNAEMAVCKVSPADPKQTFAVLPLVQPGATDDGAVYDVDVLVANSDTGAIIAHIFEPAAIMSDAIVLRGIVLDTARYQLAPQMRAFGVRVNYEGSSRVDPMSDTSLDLYVLDGNSLRRVAADLTMSTQSGDWDGNCAGTFSDISRTLSFGPTARNGYATLLVAEKSVDSVNKPSGSECATKEKPAVRKNYSLEYDGAKYVVPAALKYEH